MWEPLRKHNEIAEVTEQAQQVMGDVSRFMSDAERFAEEIATGTVPKWKIMGRAISLNFRRGMLNSRLQRTQERQQKLMDQLGYDPLADSEPKRRQSKSKDETPREG